MMMMMIERKSKIEIKIKIDCTSGIININKKEKKESKKILFYI